MQKSALKNWLTVSNISTVLLLVFAIAMFVNPNIKVAVIKSLMKIGFFQVGIPSKNKLQEIEPLNEKVLSEIIFKNESGELVNLSQLKGKVIFLNFWATWCPPCIAEMPGINKLKQEYAENNNIIFLMIDTDGDFNKSLDFMRKSAYQLPVFVLASQIPPVIFKNSLPTTLIVDKRGKMVLHHEGSADYNSREMRAFIKNLLAAK
ncbi:MAG TPA: TlpA disulfide reductase family protein [Pelobium sp.]